MGNQNAKVSVKNNKPGLEFDEGEPKSRTNWTAGTLNEIERVYWQHRQVIQCLFDVVTLSRTGMSFRIHYCHCLNRILTRFC